MSSSPHDQAIQELAFHFLAKGFTANTFLAYLFACYCWMSHESLFEEAMKGAIDRLARYPQTEAGNSVQDMNNAIRILEQINQGQKEGEALHVQMFLAACNVLRTGFDEDMRVAICGDVVAILRAGGKVTQATALETGEIIQELFGHLGIIHRFDKIARSFGV